MIESEEMKVNLEDLNLEVFHEKLRDFYNALKKRKSREYVSFIRTDLSTGHLDSLKKWNLANDILISNYFLKDEVNEKAERDLNLSELYCQQ